VSNTALANAHAHRRKPPMLEALVLAVIGKALVIILVIIILAIIGAFALIKKVL
jgi:hypothetical protein